MAEKTSDKEHEQQPWPSLPVAWQHRISMKWLTLESLRILQVRRLSQGQMTRVLLLTSAGPVEGDLVDMADTYEDSVAPDRLCDLDVPSAVTHLRTDLWSMYAAKDSDLEPVDSAALLHLERAVFRVGGRRVRVEHMAVFANDVVAFALVPGDAV